MRLTAKVCDNARRRVLQGETLANDEKIFSIFEPHTELIQRGKEPNPIQYGHNVLVVEDAVGFVVDYRVVANGVLDQDLVVPVMRDCKSGSGGKIKSASFDRGFHTPDNQRELAEIVRTPCIAAKGQHQGRHQQKEGTVAFRKCAESSGCRVGDRRLTGRQRPEAVSGSRQARLRTLRGPGHPGAESAYAGASFWSPRTTRAVRRPSPSKTG